MTNDFSTYSTEALLRRYVSGDIDSRGEAELLRRARADEQLAEVMEGYLRHPGADHGAALRSIKSQLPRRAASTLASKFSIAAGILVLLAVGIWAWPQLSDAAAAKAEAAPMATSEQPTTAKDLAEDEQAEDLTFEAEAPAVVSEETSAPPPAGGGRKQETEAVLRQSREEAAPAAVPVVPAPVASAAAEDQADDVAVSETQEFALEEEIVSGVAGWAPAPAADVVADKPAAAAPSPEAKKVGSLFDTRLRTISGYVTDEQDRPVNRANVTLPGQPVGEFTDSTGYFELVTDKTVRQFEIGHPQYDGLTFTLPRDEDEVVINLSRSSSFSGFADEGDDQDDLFNGARTIIYPNEEKTYATPRNGMKQLREDIQAAKPADLPAGMVRISFSVQADGSLTDLEVNKKSEPALIDFVRNYLQQESEWELRGGTKATRMVVTFRLE